jgi:branched-chain amino acid transport system substrate-binding protein
VGGTSTAAAKGGDLTLGFATAQTGWLSAYDGPAVQGAKQAIKDGVLKGWNVRTVEQDTRTDVDQVASAGLKVLDNGADIMIVSGDFDLGAGAAQQAQSQGKLSVSMMAGSTKFGPLGIGDKSYSGGTAGFAQGAALAEWALEKKGWKTAYLLREPTLDFDAQMEAGFKKRYEDLGGKIVGKDLYKASDPSIAPNITRIKNLGTKPDLIVLNDAVAYAKVIRELRAGGIDTPIGSDENVDADFWKKTVPDVSGVYFVTHGSLYGDDPDPKVNQLTKTLMAKDGGKLPQAATFVNGYSVIQMIAAALKKNGGSLDGAKLAAAMQSFKPGEVKTLLGDATFTDKIHLVLKQQLRVMQIQKGKTSFIELWTPKQVPILST